MCSVIIPNQLITHEAVVCCYGGLQSVSNYFLWLFCEDPNTGHARFEGARRLPYLHNSKETYQRSAGPPRAAPSNGRQLPVGRRDGVGLRDGDVGRGDFRVQGTHDSKGPSVSAVLGHRRAAMTGPAPRPRRTAAARAHGHAGGTCRRPSRGATCRRPSRGASAARAGASFAGRSRSSPRPRCSSPRSCWSSRGRASDESAPRGGRRGEGGWRSTVPRKPPWRRRKRPRRLPAAVLRRRGLPRDPARAAAAAAARRVLRPPRSAERVLDEATGTDCSWFGSARDSLVAATSFSNLAE